MTVGTDTAEGRADYLIGEPSGHLVVAAREQLTGRVLGFELVAERGGELPEWAPGAHLDLVLPSGRLRSYSLCSDPADRSRYRIAVLAEEASRGGSVELHETVAVGTRLGYLGPRNHFALVEAERYVLVAGGIGVAPILPMALELARRGRPFTLHYAARRREDLALVDEVLAVAPDADLVLGEEGRRLDFGRLFGTLERPVSVYCCGPAQMIAAAEAASWRIGTTSLHTERFQPLPVPPRTLGVGEVGFDVELARSGRVLHVPPERSVLSVLREVLPDVPSSCGSGGCGVCETAVLAGEVDHRDRVLSVEECRANDKMMICVSRAKSPRLVLDR